MKGTAPSPNQVNPGQVTAVGLLRQHVKCLSQFFEVTVINEDCDFQHVCDKYEPDLALFESGVPNPACRRLRIANIRANAQVPKLVFLHADGFSCARRLSLRYARLGNQHGAYKAEN